MKRQVTVQAPRQATTLSKGGLPQHTAVQATPEHETASNASAETHFGHDFSRVGVRPSGPMVGQNYASTACPVFPRTCPFGGACHTCPGQVQTKLEINQPRDKYEREADRVAGDVVRMSDPMVAQTVHSDSTMGLQRVCKGCENKVQTRAANREDEEKIEVPTSAALNAPALSSPMGRGQPLPASARSFFERRMGHDFSDVRLHTDARANALARSLDARAFTHGRDIVFGTGEYAQGTSAGRHLLAHELAHTIQQGAAMPATGHSSAAEMSLEANTGVQRSAVPEFQRLCHDLSPLPAALTCPVATDSPGSSGTSVQFAIDSSDLTPAAQTTLQSVAAAWHAGGGAGVLRIDGFASVDGGEEHNCLLSCRRANAVAAELVAPSDGSPGVPDANVEVYAQGETSQFSASLAPNRRVVITTSGGAPAPGPPCGLTITGPNEVDHYCAAYVPSDAAACGVFPAPNITLRAAGAAPGTTPTWSIVRGAANASIVGTNVSASVDIQGDAASSTQGDVTVQVTDGTCTTTHALTVREPSEMTASQAPTVTPAFVQTIVTYTVRDQFGNPMDADICVDETITLCSTSHPGPMAFGDAPTNAAGRVIDTLSIGPVPGGIPAGFCRKFDQVLTAGGCGPLLHNTLVLQASGITLNHGDSCAVGDPCP